MHTGASLRLPIESPRAEALGVLNGAGLVDIAQRFTGYAGAPASQAGPKAASAMVAVAYLESASKDLTRGDGVIDPAAMVLHKAVQVMTGRWLKTKSRRSRKSKEPWGRVRRRECSVWGYPRAGTPGGHLSS